MATPKPQIRSLFPTPVCVHFLPMAQEVNAELRPLVLQKMAEDGAQIVRSQGWRRRQISQTGAAVLRRRCSASRASWPTA